MPSDPKRNRFGRIDNQHQQPASSMSHAFEPRLILPEPAPVDDEGELQLPDDLSVLAEQLHDDVAYLSNCYPPQAPNKAIPLRGATADSSSSAPRRIALPTTAAATIAVVLSIALFANRQQPTDRAERPQPPAATDSSTVPPQKPIASEAGQGPDVEPLALDQSESLLLLGKATGPEREGLLDLLQQTASTETGISF